MTKKQAEFRWTLRIEFNGLCAAEVLKPEKDEMIVHFVSDPMHIPVLAVRQRDHIASHDCSPAHLMISRDSRTPALSTIAVWTLVRGAAMKVIGVKRHALDINTDKRKVKDGQILNPESLQWLPVLGEILESSKCDRREDFAQFLLTEGVVRPGRLDPERQWKISVNGNLRDTRPLAITVVYELPRRGRTPTVLDLHPGMIVVAPPDDAESGYVVDVTASSLPVAHQEAPHYDDHGDPVPHFNEYNRLVGTDKNVSIEEVRKRRKARALPDPFRSVEDPIHCFDAGVMP